MCTLFANLYVLPTGGPRMVYMGSQYIFYIYMIKCVWLGISFQYIIYNTTTTIQHFNTSVIQQFYPIKITTTWTALPSEVGSSRTVNSFKNSLDKHRAENPPNVRVNWWQSPMSCTIKVCTNSRRPAFSWKWTQRSVLLLLLLSLSTIWFDSIF